MPNVNELIGELYEVATSSDDWSPFVEILAEAFDAPFTSLRARARSAELATTVASAVEPRYVSAYNEYFHLFDPLKERLRRVTPGTTVTLPDIALDPAMTATEYYQDFLRPMGCAHLFAVWTFHDGNEFIGFGLGRSACQSPFRADELQELSVLGSHLNRASRLRAQANDRARAGSNAEQLTGQFGLTPKEAQVAVAIAGGQSVEAIGTSLGIGRETVRFHLRSLFMKTDTHSQAQLVSRLLLSASRQN
ncbi:MAG: helix-turn-helix transcriptional regulator [Bauldia sp.]|nr:helix-turn-helix transcriptional regulator [Bauldia sp.]